MEDTKIFFNRFSSNYDNESFYRTRGTEFCSKIELEFIKTNLLNIKSKNVLDVGVGTGRISSILLKKGAKVIGIDASPKMIEQAKRKLHNSMKFIIYDIAKNLPFQNNTFSAIICIRVLKYIPTWRFVIKEFKRVIKKDGTLIIEISNKFSIASLNIGDTKYFLFNPFEFEKVLKENGFKIEKHEAGLRLPFPLYGKINNNSIIKILTYMEKSLNIILPYWFLSRNIFYICKKC